MNAETALQLPFNGRMMEWARNWRGRTVEEAGKKIGVTPDRVLSWERGNEKPTVAMARRLADFYGRSFMEFFYPDPPEIIESGLIPDYRVHKGAGDPQANREVLEIQRWAELQRINALDLYDDLDETAPAFPEALHASINDDVEEYAIAARDALDFSFATQRAMKYKDIQDLPSTLRGRMEAAGVLVLRENSLTQYGVSGMTIVQFPLPIIVYASEAPARSVFTLMHEFAHVVLRESAISGPERDRLGASRERRVERWCDKFAAAFLAPKAAVEELRGPRPPRPAKEIEDITLAAIAKHFKISRHAMLLRLVDLKYIEEDFYWTIKRPHFLADEKRWKSGGIAKVWASRIWNQLGHTYTSLVLEALGTGKIQAHQAQTLFGIRNPAHLAAIQQEFRGV